MIETQLDSFFEGTATNLGEWMGGRLVDGGAEFAVWAPNAASVLVRGEFSGPEGIALENRQGVWTGTVDGLEAGTRYHFVVRTPDGRELEKIDPFALRFADPSAADAVLWDSSYAWGDDRWMRQRAKRQSLDAPISVYEVHAGSWKRFGAKGPDYRRIARPLADYCQRLNFTHVEFLPLTEHPFYGSWGYQSLGYFAPTGRYGDPDDLKYLVDTLHQAGIGVFLDWVPSHFPMDPHGLASFDGTPLFEHGDPKRGYHPDWKSAIFDYGRPEVRSFLISSALHWLREFHVDGLRVDAVASMLYLDYSRNEGEWEPNRDGGRENLEAIEFIRQFNETVHHLHPDVLTIAEESTAWPGVSHSAKAGGLGFSMKWDMGWMHDSLEYFGRDPVHRQYHHNDITFRAMYQFRENFMLALSHDEVVHAKGSLYRKMAGNPHQKLANLRLLLAYMMMAPGKKLLFMGSEFAQDPEWDHDGELNWEQLRDRGHKGIRKLVKDLNEIYTSEPFLGATDFDSSGFRWSVVDDSDNSVFAFVRERGTERVLCALNCTPVGRWTYNVPVDNGESWDILVNTDRRRYGGTGKFRKRVLHPHQSRSGGWEIELNLPPLAAVILLQR